ncbi:MAG: 2-C-methyl-D-erythritol 4-phosphate cytidylyltransferase [Spirochaetes bacterium GWD1_27_9]|nr:MAG: 2-C-methyl-D-erythritol 4-phosphate cytidylyltransferase [Spirochaetes bacterium GWC1_27_15]OHD31164.1 MAG: 2-C-methyl-D-erythritol 4-phosphate cytidylyltransferase [Spirochaetes bacterium GWD1_27_9]
MKEKLTVVILGAGSGTRFGSNLPKIFVKINGKPLLWYSLYSFQNVEEVENIYVVVSPDRLEYARTLQKKFFKKITKFRGFITGGKTRFDSVLNALKIIQMEEECNFVAIHDAARPFIKPELINKIFTEAIKVGASSCGISVVDTIKSLDEKGFIHSHLKREHLVSIQTPQIFNFQKLIKSYQIAKKKEIAFTDDTEVYSLVDKKISIIEGDNDLTKITYKEDLKTAKEILKRNRNLWR